MPTILEFNGAKIRELRKKLHIPQTRLAEMTGLGATSILNYEKGKRTPPASELAKIALALRTKNINQFFREIKIEDDPRQMHLPLGNNRGEKK